MTKIHRITLLVVDDYGLGAERVKEVIENQRYPNDCIGPTVLTTETREIEWSDEHPINDARTMAAAVAELFEEEGPDALRSAVELVTAYAGCGDNSCNFVKPTGMATNGGCRCVERGGARPGLTPALAQLYKAALRMVAP